MSIKAKLFIWDSFGLWVGHIAPSKLHQHHAIQLNASGDSCCEYRLDQSDAFTAQPAFLIDANIRHQIRVASQRGLNLYIEPQSSIGRTLRAAFFSENIPVSTLPAVSVPETAVLLNSLNSISDAHQFVQELIGTLIAIPTLPSALDQRVHQVIRHIQTHLSEPLTIEILASLVQLSPYRLMHLFNEQVGVPIRRYILWRRIIHASADIGQGHLLTAAAHNAGFADSAHMSRTFRTMMGHTPSSIFSRFVQAFFDLP